MKYKFSTMLFGLMVISNAVASNQYENVIYVGSGSSDTGSNSKNGNKSPFSIGYLSFSNTTDKFYGFDFSGEGSKNDSTWGQYNVVKQATSFNFILGKNLGKTEYSRYDIAAIVGFRNKTSSCPSSYLGYQCYANTEPKNNYTLNYGMALTWSYKSLMLGVRASGESNQVLAGIRY